MPNNNQDSIRPAPQSLERVSPAGVPEAPAVSLIRSLEGMAGRNRACIARMELELSDRQRLLAARREFELELAMHIDHLRARL
jgi:hypothetical protein